MILINIYEKKTAFQSKPDPLQTGYTDTIFCSCDLDLDPITYIYKLDVKTIQQTLIK